MRLIHAIYTFLTVSSLPPWIESHSKKSRIMSILSNQYNVSFCIPNGGQEVTATWVNNPGRPSRCFRSIEDASASLGIKPFDIQLGARLDTVLTTFVDHLQPATRRGKCYHFQHLGQVGRTLTARLFRQQTGRNLCFIPSHRISSERTRSVPNVPTWWRARSGDLRPWRQRRN